MGLIAAYHEKQKMAVYTSSSGSSLAQIPLDKNEKLIELDDIGDVTGNPLLQDKNLG